MSNTKIPNVGVHHLALFANDFDKSIKFYTEGLGFEKVSEWGEGTGRAAMLDIGNGSCFEIFGSGSANEQKDAKFGHFAFATSDTDVAYKNALAAGAVSDKEPADIFGVIPNLSMRIAFVKGPDGEVLEFFKVL